MRSAGSVLRALGVLAVVLTGCEGGGSGTSKVGPLDASPGTVAIRFQIMSGGPYCFFGEGIDTLAGKRLETRPTTSLACETCAPFEYVPLGAYCQVAGVWAVQWDGKYYEYSSCHYQGEDRLCVFTGYAAKGRYTALACGYECANLTLPGADPCLGDLSRGQVCGAVEFDFPSTEVASGTVPSELPPAYR